MGVDVEAGAGVKVGAGVKIWVGEAVSDEGGEARFVPAQAERMYTIHTMRIHFDLFMIP